jgi:hypothetical protein
MFETKLEIFAVSRIIAKDGKGTGKKETLAPYIFLLTSLCNLKTSGDELANWL